MLPPARQDAAGAVPSGTGTCAGGAGHEGRPSRAMSRDFGTVRSYLAAVGDTPPGVFQTHVLTWSVGGIASLFRVFVSP